MTQECQPVAEHITTSDNHRQGFAASKNKVRCKAQAGTTKQVPLSTQEGVGMSAAPSPAHPCTITPRPCQEGDEVTF